MKRKINKQAGFSAVVVLLFLILIAIIGFTGYYVWHSQSQTNKTLTSATNESQTATKSTSSTPKTTTSNSDAGYFVIKEWKVRVPLTASLTPVYTIKTSGAWTWAAFSSKELNLSDPACTTAAGSGGMIYRYTAAQKLQATDGSTSTLTVEQAIANGSISTGSYSHIGNYFYTFTKGSGDCGSSDYSHTIQQETRTVISQIASGLAAAPN